MAVYYYGSRISPNMTLTPEGVLICHDVPIARIGTMEYRADELGVGGDPTQMLTVHRTEVEVFAVPTLASFEGKPITDLHPPEDVVPANYATYQRGHVQHVRRGTGELRDYMIADLWITDPLLIADVQHNVKREVSCGYDCQWTRQDDGHIVQTQIRGNHVAIVPEGRAGSAVAIKDSAQAQPAADTPTPLTKEKRMSDQTKTLTPMQRVLRLFGVAVRDAKSADEVANATDDAAAAIQSLIGDTGEATSAADTTADAAAAADATATPANAAPSTANATDAAAMTPDAIAQVVTKALEPVLSGMKALSDRVAACEAGMAGKGADAKDELDSLIDALGTEIDLAENEASVTVPAEQVDAEDAGATSDAQDNARDAAKALLTKLKPAVAAIKDAGERQRVVDALRSALLPQQITASDTTAAILDATGKVAKKAKDASASGTHDIAASQQAYDARNPHKKTAQA